ncbi:hypothetical protein E2562_028115 [Oryza meyeriana var. granulata]|uniref:Uncharacterized protein n=1 Tax=Oryza meyeriana var. granulata TaxID=110450 RepID=A0A6G1C8K8_9ORYZ|nr:hypothetical protein E2562_028115 [Oryza meyeriana var. granulata]
MLAERKLLPQLCTEAYTQAAPAWSCPPQSATVETWSNHVLDDGGPAIHRATYNPMSFERRSLKHNVDEGKPQL